MIAAGSPAEVLLSLVRSLPPLLPELAEMRVSAAVDASFSVVGSGACCWHIVGRCKEFSGSSGSTKPGLEEAAAGACTATAGESIAEASAAGETGALAAAPATLLPP